MLGIFLTVTLVTIPPAAPAAEAGTVCDQSAPRCDLAPPDSAGVDVDVNADADADWPDRPRYATPALIDCRLPVVAPLLQALVGECDGTTRDTSYRASRDPESERPSGGLHPARRERPRVTALSACAGIPSEGGDITSSPSPSQPLALFALPDLPRFFASRLVDDASLLPLSRQLRPLERPPRA
jgi:hypothetical protein